MAEPQRQEFVPGDEFAKVLTETTQSLVCVLDRDGRILFFNDACVRATGYARDEVIGKDARDYVIPEEEKEAFGQVLDFIWETGLPSPQVGHWMAKDGSRRLIAWTNRLMSGNGAQQYLVTTGIDLTARIRAPEGGAFEDDPEARLAEIGQLAQEQRALRRVATLVASQATPERVFMAVSEEAARVLEVTSSAVLRFEGDDTATIVGRYEREDVGVFPLGERIDVDAATSVGLVLYTKRPARIDDHSTLPGERAKLMMQIGYRSTVAAPVVVAGIIWGAIAIASPDVLPKDSESRLAGFCELVSLAVASTQARDDLSTSRARIVHVGDEQRRKLERNLHDGAQQRLVSLALQLRLAKAQLAEDPEAAARSLDGASQELDLALEELRELARGLHPGTLTEHGLANALEALSSRLPVQVELEAPVDRLPPAVEGTAYYIVSETLTNVAKHAQATRASVKITVDDEAVRFEIVDDGRGGADPSAGTGIIGLRDRAEAAGGTLYVVSPPGKGTVVTATLPLGD